ncbi:MAG: transcriptional regulator, partial [Proteobacteria bacterium]|nr:transcriptional regulator [Pseudomonadota bacterium]
MEKQELIERLRKYEWDDIEVKKARRGVPEDAYSTVSAFANTSGGWLVFGVKETDKGLKLSGVEKVDKVQNDFLSCIRTRDKLNQPIDIQGEIHEIDGKALLAFYVPESPRADKPVYLKRDIRQSYIRRGGGDERCTPGEIQRFLRDAGARPYDSEPSTDFAAETFFDERTLTWYRQRYNEREPGRHETLENLEFLLEWGFIVETPNGLVPTRAAVILFGKGRHVRRLTLRPVVDFQIIHGSYKSWSLDRRWDDRIVVEDNIIKAWLAIVERYMKFADRPFELDAATLRRHDEPPDYISFREAAINLLIHQDYGDHGRHAEIRLFKDRTRFWNPGDAFSTTDQLLDPGAKEVRNPGIVAAFRRIGLSDQAGTGIRAIFRNWRQLGHVPPEMSNYRDEKSFKIVLHREKLLSEKQRRFQKGLGVHLSEPGAELFAFACRQSFFSLTDAKAVTGFDGLEARKELDALVGRELLKPYGAGFALADYLRRQYNEVCSLSTDSSESGIETGLESGLGTGLGSGPGTGLESGPGTGLESGPGTGLESGPGT